MNMPASWCWYNIPNDLDMQLLCCPSGSIEFSVTTWEGLVMGGWVHCQCWYVSTKATDDLMLQGDRAWCWLNSTAHFIRIFVTHTGKFSDVLHASCTLTCHVLGSQIPSSCQVLKEALKEILLFHPLSLYHLEKCSLAKNYFVRYQGAWLMHVTPPPPPFEKD